MTVSIPLEQGNVFRLKSRINRRAFDVSIPLEQGNVFRQSILKKLEEEDGLNPFGTGQCLSTNS